MAMSFAISSLIKIPFPLNNRRLSKILILLLCERNLTETCCFLLLGLDP